MAGYYTVQQGDYLSKIATVNGFLDYHTIWDHPDNAAFKMKRQNHNVLFPGDRLFIPEKEERNESLQHRKASQVCGQEANTR